MHRYVDAIRHRSKMQKCTARSIMLAKSSPSLSLSHSTSLPIFCPTNIAFFGRFSRSVCVRAR